MFSPETIYGRLCPTQTPEGTKKIRGVRIVSNTTLRPCFLRTPKTPVAVVPVLCLAVNDEHPTIGNENLHWIQ